MLPFGIGASEVILIMVVVLLVMGPGKLPEIARAMGRGVRVLRRAGQELKDAIDVEDEVARIRAWETPDPVSETAEVESIEGADHDPAGGYHDEHGHYHAHQPEDSVEEQPDHGAASVQGPVKRDEGTVIPVSLVEDHTEAESGVADSDEADGAVTAESSSDEKDIQG